MANISKHPCVSVSSVDRATRAAPKSFQSVGQTTCIYGNCCWEVTRFPVVLGHVWVEKADCHQLEGSITPKTFSTPGYQVGVTLTQTQDLPAVPHSPTLPPARVPGCPPPSSPRLWLPTGLPQPLRGGQCGWQPPYRGFHHPVGHTGPGALLLLPEQQDLREHSEVRLEGCCCSDAAQPSSIPCTLAPSSVKLTALLLRRVVRTRLLAEHQPSV